MGVFYHEITSERWGEADVCEKCSRQLTTKELAERFSCPHCGNTNDAKIMIPHSRLTYRYTHTRYARKTWSEMLEELVARWRK